MKRLQIIFMIGLVGILSVAVNSCSKDEAINLSGGNDDPGSMYQVAIQGMRFQPDTLYVLYGHEVTWKNLDAVVHTVTSDDNTTFNSGNINPGGNFSFTTNENFIYPYHCSIHPAERAVISIVTR